MTISCGADSATNLTEVSHKPVTPRLVPSPQCKEELLRNVRKKKSLEQTQTRQRNSRQKKNLALDVTQQRKARGSKSKERSDSEERPDKTGGKQSKDAEEEQGADGRPKGPRKKRTNPSGDVTQTRTRKRISSGHDHRPAEDQNQAAQLDKTHKRSKKPRGSKEKIGSGEKIEKIGNKKSRESQEDEHLDGIPIRLSDEEVKRRPPQHGPYVALTPKTRSKRVVKKKLNSGVAEEKQGSKESPKRKGELASSEAEPVPDTRLKLIALMKKLKLTDDDKKRKKEGDSESDSVEVAHSNEDIHGDRKKKYAKAARTPSGENARKKKQRSLEEEKDPSKDQRKKRGRKRPQTSEERQSLRNKLAREKQNGPAQSEQLLNMAHIGQVIEDSSEPSKRFEVLEQIGIGNYSIFYSVKDLGNTNEEYEMEMEPNYLDKKLQALQYDVLILLELMRLPSEKRRHFSTLITLGQTPKFKFLVTDRLGTNLFDIRRGMLKADFTKSSSYKIAITTLDALSDFHAADMIHRDINLTNFRIGYLSNMQHLIFLCGYGCAKRYHFGVEAKMSLQKPRKRLPFIGMFKFCSIASLEGYEQGPKDDLESWLWMSLDTVCKNCLPWSSSGKVMVKDLVHSRKDILYNFSKEVPKHRKLIDQVGDFLPPLLEYMHKLEFGSTIDVNYIKKLIADDAKAKGIDLEQAFDWQTDNGNRKTSDLKPERGDLPPEDPNKKKDKSEEKTNDGVGSSDAAGSAGK